MQNQKKRILIAKRLTIVILALTLMIVMLPISGTLAYAPDEDGFAAYETMMAEDEGNNTYLMEEGSEEALLPGGESEEPSLQEEGGLDPGDGDSENPKFGNVEIVKPGEENTTPGKGGLNPGNGGPAPDKGGIANGSGGGGSVLMGAFSSNGYDLTGAVPIDLSLTVNSDPGNGYTVTGTTAAFAPPNNGFRLIGGINIPGRTLTFNSPNADGKTFHVTQTGVCPTPSPKPNAPNYGTSIFANIVIEAGRNITMVVSDIDILGSIDIAETATLTLVLDGNNFIRKNISVPSTYFGVATLTIDSISGAYSTDGSLEIESEYEYSPAPGRIYALIGGKEDGEDSGNITIDGGTIRIIAYSKGAAIGGAGGRNNTPEKSGSATNTMINGGYVYIEQYGIRDGKNGAGTSGAGIGGGGGGNYQESGGSYNGGSGGNITITGGYVEVWQHTRAAGIGAGTFGTIGNILISGGTVKSTMKRNSNGLGSGEGSAIGGATGTSLKVDGHITITGGNVYAKASAVGGTGIGISNGGYAVDIRITGGYVEAEATQGAAIGCWYENRDSTIEITGGTVVARSEVNAAIGGRTGNEPVLTLGPAADVTAYTLMVEPAINAKNNSGTGYYVNAKLDAPLPAGTLLEVYKDTDAGTRFKILEPPTNYQCFAYSTKQSTPGTDTIIAYDGGGAIIGIVVRHIDNNSQILPMKNRSDYNPYNNYYTLPDTDPLYKTFPLENYLPVKLSNGSGVTVTVTEKYVDVYGVPIPGKADTTTQVNFNDDLNQYQAYFLALPGVPGYAGKGYKWDTAPDSSGTNFTAGTPPKTTMMTNRTIYLVYGLKVDVMVSKTVTNDFADQTKPFTFKVYFMDGSGNPVAPALKFNCTGGTITGTGTAPSYTVLNLAQDSIGSFATFTLSHGQTLTIHGITDGNMIRVIETPANGYTASYKDSDNANITNNSNDTGNKTVTASASVRTFSFINASDTVPPTGIIEGAGAGIALAGILFIFVGMEIAKFIRRKKAWTE